MAEGQHSHLPRADARIAWLDHAKGLCIVLVVMLYATESAGDEAGRQGWLHALAAFAQPFRMPDFFLLSGLLLSRVIGRDWRTYTDRKVVHFAYFYVLWLTILFAFQSPWMADKAGWPAVGAAYLKAYVHPFSMLWFIYLLPVFFMVTKAARRVSPLAVWLLAAALQIAQLDTDVKVLDKFAAYYVYFYSGYLFAPLLCRLADAARAHRRFTPFALALWAGLNAGLVHAGAAGLPLASLALAFAGCVAVISAMSLLSNTRLLEPLAYCGRHSLAIYLAFFIPMEVTREAVSRTPLANDAGWMALLATMGGVGGALLLHRVARGTRLRLLFERPAWFSLSACVAVRRRSRAARCTWRPARRSGR
jgi:uncharacterized membrane protein YcfT